MGDLSSLVGHRSITKAGIKGAQAQSTSDYPFHRRYSDCSGDSCGNVCFACPPMRSRSASRSEPQVYSWKTAAAGEKYARLAHSAR